jgi:hypothetical protein
MYTRISLPGPSRTLLTPVFSHPGLNIIYLRGPSFLYSFLPELHPDWKRSPKADPPPEIEKENIPARPLYPIRSKVPGPLLLVFALSSLISPFFSLSSKLVWTKIRKL